MENNSEIPGLAEILRRLDAIEHRLADVEARRGAVHGASRAPDAPTPAPQPAAHAFVTTGGGEPGANIEPPPIIAGPGAPSGSAESPARKVGRAIGGLLNGRGGSKAGAAVPEGESTRSGQFGSAERFVGGKLIGWLGALALLLGVTFFLKLAFDRGWIGPELRIALGFTAGTALFIAADFAVRRDRRPIAASLAGAGIGILTLTNWAAFELYAMFEFGTSFLIGSFISVAGFGWATTRNLFAACILSEIAALMVPVLISKGSRDVVGLSVYLGIIGAGVIACGNLRNWRVPAGLGAVSSIFLIFGLVVGPAAGRPTADAFATCATGLAGLYSCDFFMRRFRGHMPGVPEIFWIYFVVGFAFLFQGADFGQELGSYRAALRLALGLLLGAVAFLTHPEARLFRSAALIAAIFLCTFAIPLQFTGAARGIVHAGFAVLLTALARMLPTFIPLFFAFLNQLLALVVIASFGLIVARNDFEWSEQATVAASLLLSLLFTWQVLRTGTPQQRGIGQLAFIGMQAAFALVIYVTAPGARVSVLWALQALTLAVLAFRMNWEASALCAATLGIVNILRFAARAEHLLQESSVAFLNTRSIVLLCTALGCATHALYLGKFKSGVLFIQWITSWSCLGARVGAALFGAAWIGAELATAIWPLYGRNPVIFELQFWMQPENYYILFNPRATILIAGIVLSFASARIWPSRDPLQDPSARFFEAPLFIIAGWFLVYCVAVTEALGVASRELGTEPSLYVTRESARSGSIQLAVTLALALVPAAAIVTGFIRSRFHRYIGLAGLLLAAGKVTFIDLQRIALEWRMLIMIAMGIVLLGGAWMYSRVMRSERTNV